MDTQTPQAADAAQGNAEEAQTAPQPDQKAMMEEIIARKAGREPEKKEEPKGEPPKPGTAEPPAKAEPGKKEVPKSVGKMISRAESYRSRIAELQSKFSGLAAKEKEGTASELDKFKLEQLLEQSASLHEGQFDEYRQEAEAALGDAAESFLKSNEYYTPELNEKAPEFAKAIAEMPNKFKLMSEFFNAFNDGSINFEQFVGMPPPRQLWVLRKAAHLLDNPQKPEAPAAKAPHVPVPSDVTVGSEPTDQKAMMDAIVARKAKLL